MDDNDVIYTRWETDLNVLSKYVNRGDGKWERLVWRLDAGWVKVATIASPERYIDLINEVIIDKEESDWLRIK